MDFRELVYVTKVAEFQNVTEAARELYISQPSLSKIISKIEDEIGVKLFNRTTYPITLTYAGERFVESAKKILSINDNLKRELVDICNGKKGKICMGIPTERAVFMLPRVLVKFKEIYPEFEISTVESEADVLLEALRRKVVNFIILPKKAEDLDCDFSAELIYKEDLVLVAGDGVITEEYYLDRNPSVVDLTKIGHLPFIQMKKGHSMRIATDRILKANKINPKIIMETDSNIFSAQLASAGYGVTIIPRKAIQVLSDNERFCYYFIGGEFYFREVNVIYKRDSYLSAAERSLIDLIKDSF